MSQMLGMLMNVHLRGSSFVARIKIKECCAQIVKHSIKAFILNVHNRCPLYKNPTLCRNNLETIRML